jgi:hypothetical protein
MPDLVNITYSQTGQSSKNNGLGMFSVKCSSEKGAMHKVVGQLLK